MRSTIRAIARRGISWGLALSIAAAVPLWPARALTIGLDALGIDPNSLVSPDVVKSLVGFVGFGLQHRPYEPATPLGVAVGLDFSLELTLAKVPDELFANLASVGASAPTPLPVLPSPKLHLHKGFGEFLDVGASLFRYSSNSVLGFDAKVVIVQGEEGPIWALRFCYTTSEVAFNDINVQTKTYSPQLLLSRQMEFADPYLGVALEYTNGTVSSTITVPPGSVGPLPPGVTVDPYNYASSPVGLFGGMIFGGLSLKVPRSGLRVTLEGAYNTAGTSTMGTKVGFTF